MVNFFIIILSLIIVGPIHAINNSDTISIHADQFTHDKENKRIFATGNVAIIDTEFKVFANKVLYNSEKKIISAKEKVRIFYSDGTILKTESIVADNNLENGKFSKSYVYIPDELEKNKFIRIAANSIERRTSVWEVFREAVFTACDICYNEKKKKFDPPLIQLKSKKIIHDKENLMMKYYDSYLEISGNTFFYLPYFSHASPDVKRKSGFLAPKYRANSYLGNSIDVPYYYVLSDYEDLTFAPKFNTKKNPVAYFEHRKNMKKAEVVSEFSSTISDLNVNQLKKDKLRGHIYSKGKLDINKNLFGDYQIHRVTDKNYLQAFKFNYENTLNSNIRLHKLRRNNFFSFEAHTFQELRSDIDRAKTPLITPRIQSFINSEYNTDSLNYSTSIEFLTLTRDKGNDLGKLFLLQNIERPFLTKDGSNLKFGVHFNTGIYKVDNYDDPLLGTQKSSYYRSKFYPQITFNYSKPFFKINNVSKQIFEPKFLLVGGANDGNDLHLPNEDSRSYDIDFTDLFERSRLSGNDRLDNGSRVDYGFNYSNQNIKTGFVTNVLIGHSYRLRRDVFQPRNSGLNDYVSNILGVININPTGNLKLNSQFSVNSKDFTFSQAITNLALGNDNNTFYLNHLLSESTDGFETIAISRRNQIDLGFRNFFSKFWSLEVNSNFNLVNEIKFLNWNSKIKYQDECFGLSFSWNRQYTYNSESPTSNNFMLLFSINKIMENEL